MTQRPREEQQAAQLDAAAQITAADLQVAQEFARRHFTPLLNAMLDAEPESDEKRGRDP